MLKPLMYAALVLALVGLLIVTQYSDPAGKPGIFSPLDFTRAQAEAAGANPPRLLMVTFVERHSPACERMDHAVWANPRIADWMRGRAIAVRIERDKDPGHARSLGVQSVPVVILLDGKSVVTKIEGEHSARAIIEKFDAALAARRQAAASTDAAPISKAPRPDAASEPAPVPSSSP